MRVNCFLEFQISAFPAKAKQNETRLYARNDCPPDVFLQGNLFRITERQDK
jgi:hypothetical protein